MNFIFGTNLFISKPKYESSQYKLVMTSGEPCHGADRGGTLSSQVIYAVMALVRIFILPNFRVFANYGGSVGQR